MAAPQIPNLLDSLRARGSSRPKPTTRAPPRAAHDFSASSSAPTSRTTSLPPQFHSPNAIAAPTTATSTNAIIQATDTDAAGSRLSAVRAGYLTDAFAPAFYTAPDAPHVRRMPIINRGTYVRTIAVDALVDEFLARYAAVDADKGRKTCQVVSLGAGTDTRWARLWRRDEGVMRRCRWVEVDFEVKAGEKREKLKEVGLGGAAAGEGQGGGSNWDCVGMDLRELVGGEEEEGRRAAREKLKGVEEGLPTLLLSEMCLTYLPVEQASTPILRVLGRDIVPAPAPLHVVLYEPLSPHDAFGRTMIQNLAGRGIKLPGLEQLPSLESHGQRLKEAGFEGWDAETIGGWWKTRVSGAEKDRLRTVEMVDEEEEWDLLAAHYGVVWAWRNAS